MKNRGSARGRAIISGSYPSNTSQIDYFNIATKSTSNEEVFKSSTTLT